MELQKDNIVPIMKELNHSIQLYAKNFSFEEKNTAGLINGAVQALSNEEVSQISKSFQSYNDIIKDGPEPTEQERDRTIRHLKDFLKKFNLKVSDDAFSDIGNDDFVEIYSSNHKQMFRSVNFFNYCSYDLASLTFMPWNELYYRQDSDTQRMIQSVTHVLANSLPYYSAESAKVKDHILTELISEKKFRHRIKSCSCVFENEENTTIGYLTVVNTKEITTKLNIVH